MGLMDFIKGELIEIIEWTDDSRDTLSYRFPDDDKEIKNGAQLVVRESQVVQFVYLGQYGDLFPPGKHTLTTDNIPVLTTLKGWKYGFESPFKADVYFVVTRLFAGNKWGHLQPGDDARQPTSASSGCAPSAPTISASSNRRSSSRRSPGPISTSASTSSPT
jgi:membrane protease subunit (stomatin/prohibitin family)